MGLFSDIGNFFQNDIIDPVTNLFRPSAAANNSDMAAVNAEAALANATNAATAATQAATKAQTDAQLQAEAAATPPTDSESARSASDDQLRKTLAGGVYGVGMPATTGAAPVGYRLLSGSP